MKINNKVGASVISAAMVSSLFTAPLNVLAETNVTTKFPDIIDFEGNQDELNYRMDSGDVTTEVKDGKLHVKYKASDWPGVKFLPKDSKAWDLGDNGAISFTVTNPGDKAQAFLIKLDEGKIEGSGDSSSVTFNANVGAGETITYNVAVGGEIPALGMATLPPNESGSLASYGWGKKDINLNHITQITLWEMYNKEENTLIFDDIEIITNPNTDLSYMDDILDEYGQYTKAEWENKVDSNDDITGDIDSENKLLDEQIKEIDESGKYSKYGGYKNEEYRQEATGRFYTAQIDGKWTLVDPEGYPFIATGLDIIRTADMLTWVSGREQMFDNIPSKDGDLGDHYATITGIKPPAGYENFKPGDGYNFYTANLERKYGDNWYEQWTETALKRFKAWGFTSLGCWAEPETYFGQGEENKMAYVANGWVNEGRGNENVFSTVLNTTRGGTIADPFDPKFRGAAETMAAKLKSQGINEDPWCYGIYIDNEIEWGNGELPEQHYSIVDGAFSVDAANSYAKREFIEILKGNYETIEKLNDAWGTEYTKFEDLNAQMSEAEYGKIAIADKSEMLSAIADQYYRTIDEVLNEYLPNILNLGSRLANWGTSPEVVEACAKYVDVVSFNCYKEDVNQSWLDQTHDKPIIIGEFHFNAMDSGFFAPGLQPVSSQEERGDAYTNYMESVFESDKFVGAQWFQYYDQPILGRAWDGENTNAGFVDVADQPYEPLVNAAKKINEQAYDMKFGFVAAEKVDIDKANVELSKDIPTIELNATLFPEDATNKEIQWKSSNKKVVTVDQNGVVTAVGEGQATIMAVSKTNKFIVDTCGVKVTDFKDDEVETIPVKFDKIDFESTEVSYDMIVAGDKNATTEIVDIDGNKVLNVTVNKVSNAVSSSTVDFTPKDTWSFGEGNKLNIDLTNPNDYPIQARVNIRDGKGALRTYYFNLKANESRTVSIEEFGAVKDNWGDPDGFWGAADTGIDTSDIQLVSVLLWEEPNANLPTENVAFRVDNICVEEVGDKEEPEVEDILATTVTLDKETMELLVDETDKLTATVNPVDATDTTVKWTTSNPEIVTVDEAGNIIAVGAGVAYVGAVSNANSFAVDYCKVIVTKPIEPEKPDVEDPETETPDPEKPDVEDPETETPDPEKPDVEDPETETPDPDEDKEPVKPEEDKEDENLPQTGGMNSLYILLAGLGVVVSGGAVLYRNKKEK